MAKIRRLEGHRYVGARSDMVVYDTDAPNQAAELGARIGAEDLINQRLISTFGPDTIEEARNRGFTPSKV